MQCRPSADPRDQAIRAALRDASSLAAIVAGEFYATYAGPGPAGYLGLLGDYVADLGEHLEKGPTGPVVSVDGRRLAVRFGTSNGPSCNGGVEALGGRSDG